MMIGFKSVSKALNACHIAKIIILLIILMASYGCSDNIPVASVLSSGRLTLSWKDAPGAASYDLYLSTSPGVTILNSYKISGVSSPITITDLEPGTTYYFVLAVYNDSGESRNSKELSYTVIETEGSIEFDDIIVPSEPTQKSPPDTIAPVASSTKEKAALPKSKPPDPADLKDKTGAKIIICFGDSLTFGTGATTGMDYPSQLAGMIGQSIINKGIPGDTTSSALKRLQRDVLSAKPDIVLITLGGNDLKNGVSKNIAFGNLKSIVETIQKGGARVIIGGLRFPGADRGFGKGYQDLAQQTGAVLIPDIYAGVMDNPNLMSDAIHPNNGGYRIIARHFNKALGPLIKQPKAAGRDATQAAALKTSTAAQSSTAKTRDITLTWDTVPGATSYNIYWSDKPGVNKKNGTKISNATNPYKLKGLRIGKKYYFVVTAVNAVGESRESEELSYTVGK